MKSYLSTTPRSLILLVFCMLFASCAPIVIDPEVLDTDSTDDAECEVGFRLFDHPNLATDPVCIPENPQRVVPLDLNSMEFMLITDMDFVTSAELGRFFISNTHPEWLDTLLARTDGLPDTGFFPPDLEVVALAEPDLIITAPGYYDPEADKLLAEIAPTLVFEPSEDALQDWQPNFEFIGQAVGMEAETETLIASYEERIHALREVLGDSLDGQTVSVVRARPDEELGLRLAGSFTGEILRDAGIAQPESQEPLLDPETGFIQIDVSRERWDLADGDYLFVYGVQPAEAGTNEAQALIESLNDDPIWNTLNAVKNGNAHAMNAHWHGFGLLSAQDVIDDMFLILAGAEPTMPNPLGVPAESGIITGH